MKVYAVLGYNQFYPQPDNVIGVYLSGSAANEFCEKEAAESYYDFYDVVEYEVEEE